MQNKSCPFCDGLPELVEFRDECYFIRCSKCSAQGGWGVSIEGAWNWWNMRGLPPSPPEQPQIELVEPAY